MILLKRLSMGKLVLRDDNRRCSRCGKWKLHTPDFWVVDARKPSGFKAICKTCRNAYQELSRAAQASQQGRKYTKRDIYTKRQKRAMVQALKGSTPCTDCGRIYPHFVMDFDHRNPDDKVAGIAQMINMTFTWLDIQSEIDKCDLVCANCHRIRTWGGE